MKIVKEFKEFISKGNVMDLAVGIIIGAAFKAIISSFVADILMPFISLILGNVNISALKVVMRQAVGDSPELHAEDTLRVGLDFRVNRGRRLTLGDQVVVAFNRPLQKRSACGKQILQRILYGV